MSVNVPQRFPEAVARLLPNLRNRLDYRVENVGNGPELVIWPEGVPIPTDQEVATALASIDSEKASDDTNKQAIISDAEYVTMLQLLLNSSPDQIKDYINTNVTNIATAKTVLIKIILLLAMLARKLK